MAKKYPTLYKSMMGLWDSLKGIAGISWDYIKIFWKEFLKPVGEYAIENIIPPFLDIIANLIDIIAGILKACKPTFEWLLKNILTPLVKILGGILKTALEFLAKMLEKLAGFIEKHPKLIKAVVDALLIFFAAFGAYKIIDTVILGGIALIGMFQSLGGVVATASALFPTLAGGISAISTALMTLAANPVTWIIAGITLLIIGIIHLVKHWDKVRDAGTRAFNACKDGIFGLNNKMKEAPKWMQELGDGMFLNFVAPFKGINEFFISLFDQLKEMSKNGTLSITGVIEAVFKSVLNGLIAFVETSLNATIKGINGISHAFGLNAWGKTETIPTVSIPRFATGGTIPGSGVNGGILARVGDVPKGHNEFILRDDQLQAFSTRSAMDTATAIKSLGGMNSGGNFEFDLYIDGEKVNATFIQRNKKSRSITGKSVI
jgi:hypothetical protein